MYFISLHPRYKKRLIARIVNESDVLICLAKSWREFFIENFRCRKIVIVNNVVPDPGIKELPGRNEIIYPVPFLFLGRIGDNKGIFDILNVLIENKDFFKGKIKLFVGGDGESERLLALVNSHSLSEMVEFVGWVDKEKKHQLLLNSKVYILPSYKEGLPMSVLEAMAYGLPIISTPVGGIPEVVSDSVNGFLIAPGDKAAIKEKIAFFISNPLKANEFGEKSLKLVEPYLMDHVSRQLTDIYVDLLPVRRVSSRIH